MKIWRLRVYGLVQGVFYRASTQQQAQSLGLAGWVKNLRDGRVELVACGAEEILVKLEAWLKKGPPMARVDHIDIQQELDKPDTQGFEIRY